MKRFNLLPHFHTLYFCFAVLVIGVAINTPITAQAFDAKQTAYDFARNQPVGQVVVAAGEMKKGRYGLAMARTLNATAKGLATFLGKVGGGLIGAGGVNPGSVAIGSQVGGLASGWLYDKVIGKTLTDVLDTQDKQLDAERQRKFLEADTKNRREIADQIAKGQRDADDFMKATADHAKAKAQAERDRFNKDFRKAAAARDAADKAKAAVAKVAEADAAAAAAAATDEAKTSADVIADIENIKIEDQGAVWNKAGKITLTKVTGSDGKITIIYTTIDKNGKAIATTTYDGDNINKQSSEDAKAAAAEKERNKKKAEKEKQERERKEAKNIFKFLKSLEDEDGANSTYNGPPKTTLSSPTKSSLTQATQTTVEKGYVINPETGSKITLTEVTDKNFKTTIIYTATDGFGHVLWREYYKPNPSVHSEEDPDMQPDMQPDVRPPTMRPNIVLPPCPHPGRG